jgi:hypothetical protein
MLDTNGVVVGVIAAGAPMPEWDRIISGAKKHMEHLYWEADFSGVSASVSAIRTGIDFGVKGDVSSAIIF